MLPHLNPDEPMAQFIHLVAPTFRALYVLSEGKFVTYIKELQ